MNRPQLKDGDIVKLSKKGRVHPRQFSRDSTLVVSNILGDGVDRSSIIKCRVEINGLFQHFDFYRSELWFTGSNAFTEQVDLATNSKPKSDDGEN